MLPAFFTLPLLLVVALLPLAETAAARPTRDIPEISEPELEVDVVGDVDGTYPVPQKALQDTIWIPDWTFDTGAPCSAAGWKHVDGHVLNDGAIWWHVETGFTTTSGMAVNSAAVGYHDNMCCVDTDGYDNDWYQAGIPGTRTRKSEKGPAMIIQSNIRTTLHGSHPYS